MLVVYRNGLPVRRNSPILLLPLDSDATGIRTYNLDIASPTCQRLHFQATECLYTYLALYISCQLKRAEPSLDSPHEVCLGYLVPPTGTPHLPERPDTVESLHFSGVVD